jgi:pyridoxal phosphate enzyme (YggS family)
MLHTIDGASLAREVGKRAAKAGRERLPVLVEVNVGGEPQKHGTTPAELSAVLAAVDAEPTLRVRGLMTIPPADLEGARRAFEALRSLQRQHGGSERLPELSMGMSHDLEVAVACGATLVRVGTAIFGER